MEDPRGMEEASAPDLGGGWRRGRRARRIAGFVVGVVLLGAAVWTVRGQWDPMREAWGRLGGGWRWAIPVLLGLPLVSWALVSWTFAVLTKPDAQGRWRVGMGEMAALIGVSGLANYLPMKPGLVGRVAYHKAVNGIPVAESAGVIAANVGCGFAGCVLVVAAGVGAIGAERWLGGWGHGAWGLPACVVIPGVVLWWIGWGSGAGRTRRWSWAVGLRYADTLAWAVRYWVVFGVVGKSITPAQAAVFAAASNVAMLVPVAGNGLGVREWAIGLLAPALPGWLGEAGSLREALSADLINRVAEVAVTIPLGLVCGGWVVRRAGLGWMRGPEGGGTPR